MGEPLRPEADECVDRSHAARVRAVRCGVEIRIDEHLKIFGEPILEVGKLFGIEAAEDIGDRRAGINLGEGAFDDLREDTPVEHVDAGEGRNGFRAVCN